MRKPAALLFAGFVLLLQLSLPGYAQDENVPSDLPETSETPTPVESNHPPQPVVPPAPPQSPFQAFTGKVTKNKVRLRLQPNLDGPILRELKQGDLLIVVGETDDFYAVSQILIVLRL